MRLVRQIKCWTVLLLLPYVGATDNTTQDAHGHSYVGWRSGSGDRSTMTLFWNCFTAIVACTWTILHLNVPGPRDKLLKTVRKAKLMAITIIFPEFIFAKSICELQMAIEDLHDLKMQESSFGWKVEFGAVSQLLYRVFQKRYLNATKAKSIPRSPPNQVSNPSKIRSIHGSQRFETSTSEERVLSEKLGIHSWYDATESKARTWTLTHCYFTNMGGLVFGELHSPWFNSPLTSHGLVKCCVPMGHNPLHELRLSELEIADRSKADCLVRVVATLQIFWLVVSVITRVTQQLPVSQLEVCTVAFATLAVATYAANWAKPKDVEVPIRVTNPSPLGCQAVKFNGTSFVLRSAMPSAEQRLLTNRITNDTIRPQTQDAQFTTFSLALAFSTVVLGGIHCAAWRAYYPTQVERLLWMVASVLSTTIPLSTLIGTSILNFLHRRKIERILKQIIAEGRIQHDYDYSQDENQVLFHKDGAFWSLGELHNYVSCAYAWDRGNFILEPSDLTTPQNSADIFAIVKTLHSRIILFDAQIESCLTEDLTQIDVKAVWTAWLGCKRTYKRLQDAGWRMTDIPINTPQHRRLLSVDDIRSSRNAVVPEERWKLILNLLVHADDKVVNLHDEWRQVSAWVDGVSRIFTLFSVCLYGMARTVILVLALMALQRQDERLYLDTWARFLPSIG